MALITRYFSTTGAGAADGTSWADRAALFSSGNWSSVITGFSFAGSDSLRCLVGPGTYTCSQSLTTAVITPSIANMLFVHACDSSGNVLEPPDPDWVSSQPFTTTGMPVIATTTNISTTTLTNSFWRLISFTASGRTGGSVISNSHLDWCTVVNSTNNTSATGVVTSNTIRNSQILMTGAAWGTALDFGGGAAAFSNIRIDGTGGASGSRLGVTTSSAGIPNVEQLTIIGCAGGGFFAAAGATTRYSTVRKSLIINCGTYGFRGNATASQTLWHQVIDSVIVNSVIGIDAQSAARVLVSNCRLRNNTTSDFNGMGNYPTDHGVITSAGTDADEFVDAAAGDYRIKNTSSLWGKNLGPGDEPTPAQAYLLIART